MSEVRWTRLRGVITKSGKDLIEIGRFFWHSPILHGNPTKGVQDVRNCKKDIKTAMMSDHEFSMNQRYIKIYQDVHDPVTRDFPSPTEAAKNWEKLPAIRIAE